MKDFRELYDTVSTTSYDDLRNQYSKMVKLFMLYGLLFPNGVGSLQREQIPSDRLDVFDKEFANGISAGVRPLQDDYGIEYTKEKDRLVFSGIKKIEQRPVIPKTVRKLVGTACVVINTSSKVEIDHKFDYGFYNDDKFRNEEKNYQPLNRAVNSKKREECKRRITNGNKFDNTKVGCAFSTVRHSIAYAPDLYSTQDPYDGDYWTDPHNTLQLDRRYYTEYYVGLKTKIPDLTYEQYEETFIPKINELLKTLDIEKIDEIVSLILDWYWF